MSKDIYGEGLFRYFQGEHELEFKLHNDYGSPEMMPIEAFFEEAEDITELESKALSMCKGRTLDLGAGAGRHALMLQSMGLPVLAIDISPKATELMQTRGVKDVRKQDIFKMDGSEKFDSILMLMNGMGLAQTLDQLPNLLRKLKSLLNKDGKVIFDSSDLSYLYENEPLPFDKYYGEVKFRYELDGKKGPWFGWVYLDPKTMRSMAEKEGFHFELIMTDENDQYLATLSIA